jgi:hypothetical protein
VRERTGEEKREGRRRVRSLGTAGLPICGWRPDRLELLRLNNTNISVASYIHTLLSKKYIKATIDIYSCSVLKENIVNIYVAPFLSKHITNRRVNT